MKIIGKKFTVDFGAKATLYIESETSLSFIITEKDGAEVNETETVTVQITEIRPKIFMLTWKEKNGNTVVQLQDHKKETVYINWIHPDGNLTSMRGILKPA